MVFGGMHKYFFYTFRFDLYRVLRAESDLTLILQSATSCESDESPAEKNACVHLEPVVHIVYLLLIINQVQ